MINEVDTFVAPKEEVVYSEGNEAIVPASGETAKDIARASAIEKSGVLLGGDLNILRPFDFINPLFLALAISNGESQKELSKTKLLLFSATLIRSSPLTSGTWKN